MATGLIALIKQTALDAVDARKPTELRYGTITSVNPLKVQITNSFTLPSSLLVVPKRLKKDDPLIVGDKVALIRAIGGQSYYIIDKI